MKKRTIKLMTPKENPKKQRTLKSSSIPNTDFVVEKKEKAKKIIRKEKTKYDLSKRSIKRLLQEKKFDCFKINQQTSQLIILKCNICHSKLMPKKSVLMKHLNSDKHLKAKRRFEKIRSEDIPKKLVKVFYQCGINLSEDSKLLENNQFIDIIKSIKHIPSNSTLRRTVHQLLEEEQNRITEVLKKPVFSLIIDETTDSSTQV
ncbi:hypothetical protein M0812_16885 [Anaeramoeba flamelloides]|uniref:Uncharacterized protein n=1 Tax=Anaeramoeba flamelloides TaxID=1746091 RepID=A0AAV7ZBY9_9EUKA|nr:hypothetical protein M0812_16885 [Anaeramoeba flamelloides]